MTAAKIPDIDQRLRRALHLMSVATIALLALDTARFLVPNGIRGLPPSFSDLELVSHGSMLFAVGFSAIILLRINVSQEYRLNMAFVLMLTVARGISLALSSSWHAPPADLLLWRIAEPAGILAFYTAMGLLCTEFELYWARARWQTAKFLLLCALCGVLLYEFQGANVMATLGRSIEQEGLPVEVLAYIITALPFVYGVAAMSRTARDFHVGKVEGHKASESDAARFQWTGLWIIIADEALLVVLIGNTLWATALLVQSISLFSAGATFAVMGFALEARKEALSAAEISSTTGGHIYRLAWRQAAILASLFVLVFIARPRSLITVLPLGVTTMAVLFQLDPVFYSTWPSQGRAENFRSSTFGTGLSRPWGVTLMIVGWIESIAGLAIILVTLSPWFNRGNISSNSVALTWQELSRHWNYIDWKDIFGRWYHLLAGGVLIGAGQRFRWHARQHLSRIISAPPQGKSFILYLRPFRDDPKLAELEAIPRLRGAAVPILLLQELFFSGRSEEEQLVAALKKGNLGPVIAVGAPGEWRPPSGAMRMYLQHHDWQKSVQELMSRASLVVIVLGVGAGTMWELVEATRMVPPERLLLIVPMPELEYERFREKAMAELHARAERIRNDTGRHWSPPELPGYPQGVKKMHGRVQMLIYFFSNWKPVVLPLGAVRFSIFYDTLTLPLRAALYHVFTNAAEYEQRNSSGHKKRGVTLWIVGELFEYMGWTINLIQLMFLVFTFTSGQETVWTSLPIWFRAVLTFFAIWQMGYGRMLRFKARYYIDQL
jgi:hypothetical protein